MSQGHSRDRLVRGTRGAAVVLACAALGLPLLVASGGAATPADAVLAAARAQVGEKYVWGATGPDSWDCSGLTSVTWHDAGGVQLPRTADAQQRWAVPIPVEQLLPGDLVFYGAPVTHVALYEGGDRIIDASASRGQVVERAMWAAPVVRYGRVPRPGMPAVAPWTPPPLPVVTSAPSPVATAPVTSTAPVTVAAPVTAAAPPVAEPAAKPVAKPVAQPAGKPVAKAPATPTAAPVQPAPLAGLPNRQAAPSSALALRAVAGARSILGDVNHTEVSLVRDAWRHAGGGVLPTDRDALVARGAGVALKDARVGDLVVYGAPSAHHVSLYAGGGLMVGVATNGRVSLRPVYTSTTVHLVRLG